LPDATVILQGSKGPSFPDYRRAAPAAETIQACRADFPGRHALYCRKLDANRSPKLIGTLEDGTVPTEIRLRDGETVNLRLILDDNLGPVFQRSRFEITVYIDNEPYLEEGQPYLPYIFALKASYFTAGPHVFTINAGNFTNQMNSFSFKVVKE